MLQGGTVFCFFRLTESTGYFTDLSVFCDELFFPEVIDTDTGNLVAISPAGNDIVHFALPLDLIVINPFHLAASCSEGDLFTIIFIKKTISDKAFHLFPDP